MAWIVNNRLKPYAPTRTEPYITEKIRTEIEQKYFPRLPDEARGPRAAVPPDYARIRLHHGPGDR